MLNTGGLLQNEAQESDLVRQLLNTASSLQKDWWSWSIHVKIHTGDIPGVQNGSTHLIVLNGKRW